jgi:hypothetical protein
MICILTDAFLGCKLNPMCHFGYIHKRPIHPSTALTLWARLMNQKHVPPRYYRLDVPRIECRWRRHFPCFQDRPRLPPSLLRNGYPVFSCVRTAWAWYLPPISFKCWSANGLEVNIRLPSISMGMPWGGLYLYCSPHSFGDLCSLCA